METATEDSIRLFITPKQFGEMLGRSPAWVRRECREGRIPTYPKQKRPYLIPRQALSRATELETPGEFIKEVCQRK